MKPWPEYFPLYPDTASTIAPEVDAIYFFGLFIAVFFSLLIALAIVVLAVKYRRRGEHEIGEREHAPAILEIVWSVIPFVILMTMFTWGAKVYFHARRPPAHAIDYYVTGKQWMWKFQHPQGNREINQLHVPVRLPIRLTMISEDVIHSFFVPDFRIKHDVLPGRYTDVWFEATKTGTYHLFCAEYCGAEHSLMGGSIVVMEPAAYEDWLAGEVLGPSTIASGPELFQKHACDTCHRSDSAVQGPILSEVFGRERRFADGSTRIADENYLRQSILDPGSQLVEGYNPLMPTYSGKMSEEELVQLIIYIKGQAAPEEPAGEDSQG